MGVMEREQWISQVKNSKVVPNETKDIMVKMIIKFDQLLSNVLGTIELAFRRGDQGEIPIGSKPKRRKR